MKKEPTDIRYPYIIERLKHIGEVPKGLVIDCACGKGGEAALIANEGFDIMGFDMDARKVAQAKEQGINAQQRNICKMGLEKDMADGFICSETLEYLNHKETVMAIREIQNVCKKGAIVCLLTIESEKVCLKDPLHKQYLNLEDILNYFHEFKLLDYSEFYRRKGICNLVLIFKNELPY